MELENCNDEKLKASIFVHPQDLKSVVKSLKSREFESVETFDSSFQPGVSFVGKPSDIDEWVGEDNEFGITEDDIIYEIHQINQDEYSVICFCGENEIFVGVVESYIVKNKTPKHPDVETLQFLPYNKDTKYAKINYGGDFGDLFSIYYGGDIPEENNLHFGLDDKKNLAYFGTGGIGYFQLEPNKGIWIENGGYSTGKFRLIEGKEKVISLINLL